MLKIVEIIQNSPLLYAQMRDFTPTRKGPRTHPRRHRREGACPFRCGRSQTAPTKTNGFDLTQTIDPERTFRSFARADALEFRNPHKLPYIGYLVIPNMAFVRLCRAHRHILFLHAQKRMQKRAHLSVFRSGFALGVRRFNRVLSTQTNRPEHRRRERKAERSIPRDARIRSALRKRLQWERAEKRSPHRGGCPSCARTGGVSQNSAPTRGGTSWLPL